MIWDVFFLNFFAPFAPGSAVLNRVRRGRRNLKKIHPKLRENLPLVGIFATRTQYRPNPIGLTLVELVWRKKNILRVRGLDAMNGTPVIDIKPISPRQEFLKEPKVPKWYDQLWSDQNRQKDDFRHSL